MPKVVYKPRKCLNPDCPDGEFIPTRSDKLYCDDYCRGRHFRIATKESNKKEYKDSQDLKRIDKSLHRLYLNCKKNNIETLTEQLFLAEDIDCLKAVSMANDKLNGHRIHWYYKYGIMGVSQNQFKIVKKTDYEN